MPPAFFYKTEQLKVRKNVGMKVEFSGGLDTLFGSRTLTVDAPEGADVKWLLHHLEPMASDPSLFLQDGLLRPGILALINDTDWELLDEEAYVLQPGDVVHFASTLHGG